LREDFGDAIEKAVQFCAGKELSARTEQCKRETRAEEDL
jgi:hypothetical protein